MHKGDDAGGIGLPDTHSTHALCIAAEAERQAHEKLAKNVITPDRR